MGIGRRQEENKSALGFYGSFKGTQICWCHNKRNVIKGAEERSKVSSWQSRDNQWEERVEWLSTIVIWCKSSKKTQLHKKYVHILHQNILKSSQHLLDPISITCSMSNATQPQSYIKKGNCFHFGKNLQLRNSLKYYVKKKRDK